jgi:hypothetical protein
MATRVAWCCHSQRDHPDIKVKGELHLMVNIEDSSTVPASEATAWAADPVAVADAVAAMPIVVAEAEQAF